MMMSTRQMSKREKGKKKSVVIENEVSVWLVFGGYG